VPWGPQENQSKPVFSVVTPSDSHCTGCFFEEVVPIRDGIGHACGMYCHHNYIATVPGSDSATRFLFMYGYKTVYLEEMCTIEY